MAGRQKRIKSPKFRGKVMFPSKYLTAEDLPGDVTLTIKAVAEEVVETDDGRESKFIIAFEGQRKKMILSAKTNAAIIAHMYGWDAEKWAGKRITLYPTTCMAFGQNVDCIRFRDRVPADAAAAPDLGSDEDENGNGHTGCPDELRGQLDTLHNLFSDLDPSWKARTIDDVWAAVQQRAGGQNKQPDADFISAMIVSAKAKAKAKRADAAETLPV